MNIFFENLRNFLKKDLSVLWIFSVVLGLAIIVLQVKHKLPLGMGDFVFITIFSFCVALYRPRWVFYVFISLAPLENIILISGFLPMQLRPYQFAGAILAAALIILWSVKRLNFVLLKPIWIDWLIFSLVPLGFLSLVSSPNLSISLKNNIILFSFVVFYFVVRNFVRTRKHLVEAAFFFLASNVVVLAYGFLQVFADKFGRQSFEVMFGRPNSTFTEPDWLGIYLCFALAIFLSFIAWDPPASGDRDNPKTIQENSGLLRGVYPDLGWARTDNIISVLLYLLIFLNINLLILTLSRSAWIGAAAVIFFFFLFSLLKKIDGKAIFTPREFKKALIMVIIIMLISIAGIQFGKLTKFDLFDRARSAATSEQKITIACETAGNVPQTIADTNDLEKYNCRHINLEEINSSRLEGKFITEIFRKDPNVMTRGQIYKKSIEILRDQPVLGVGFGTITQMLGSDERGTGLNESNIFLQVWAGSGILGLLAFTTVLGYLFIYAFRRISPICPVNKFFGCPVAGDDFETSANLFVILGLFALMIPNLFNAGLFMGLFWMGLGVFISFVRLR